MWLEICGRSKQDSKHVGAVHRAKLAPYYQFQWIFVASLIKQQPVTSNNLVSMDHRGLHRSRSYLRCCWVCRQQSPVYVTTITQIWVINFFGCPFQYLGDKVLTSCRSFDEQLNSCSQESKLYLKDIMNIAGCNGRAAF